MVCNHGVGSSILPRSTNYLTDSTRLIFTAVGRTDNLFATMWSRFNG